MCQLSLVIGPFGRFFEDIKSFITISPSMRSTARMSGINVLSIWSNLVGVPNSGFTRPHHANPDTTLLPVNFCHFCKHCLNLGMVVSVSVHELFVGRDPDIQPILISTIPFKGSDSTGSLNTVTTAPISFISLHFSILFRKFKM